MMTETTRNDKPLYQREGFIFGLIAFVNILNYVDRGIIPGATNEINSFIKGSIDTGTPDVYLGLLQSSFIIGFMAGSLIFGHLIHAYGRFTLTGIGCSIWVLAVFLSGSAYYADSYVFLLFARIMSGFAEASLQCSIPPWIQRTAPPHQKGLWLAIFYTAIPVGTALGYAYSSLLAESVGWQWAFFLEGFIMIPFVLYMFHISPHFPPDKHPLAEDDSESKHPTVWQEVRIVCGRPVFLCFSLAYAAQSATLMGLSTFGSAFMMGLGFFNTESEASTVFGVVVSISGLIFTPVGGILLDRLLSDHRTRASSNAAQETIVNEILEEIDEQQLAPLVVDSPDPVDGVVYTPKQSDNLRKIALFVAGLTTVGGALLVLMFFVRSKELFLTLVTFGCGIIFATNSAINMGVLLSVPTTSQSFAIAINNVCLHALGDVPSPVIVGLLKDMLAPGCIAKSDDDGNIASSSDCRDDAEGLRITMLLCTLWLFWTIFFYLLAWYLADNGSFLFPFGILDAHHALGDGSSKKDGSAILKDGDRSWQSKNLTLTSDSQHSPFNHDAESATTDTGHNKDDDVHDSIDKQRDDVDNRIEMDQLLQENANPNPTRSVSGDGVKSRVLSSDEVGQSNSVEKQLNVEKLKRFSRDSTTSVDSKGKKKGKQGLLAKEALANRTREIEDIINI